MSKSTEKIIVGFWATVEDFESMVQFLETDGFDEMKSIVNRILKGHSEDLKRDRRKDEVFIKVNPFCADLIEEKQAEDA